MAVEVLGTQIRVPQGDTGAVKFVCNPGVIADSDRAMFTVSTRNGGVVMRKVLSPQIENIEFHLPLVFSDTSAMRPDTYEWSLRIVRGGTFGENGKILSADGINTPVIKGRMTIIPVAGGAR